MEQNVSGKITANEFTFILIGIMLDVSVASLPNGVAEIAKQDGWISVIIGALYPLYIGVLAIYVSKKHPNENILILSKKYLGSILGNICNILFLVSFFSYYPPLISLVGIIGRTYVVPFLSDYKIHLFLILVGIFAANKGIKLIGKVCTISFYIVLLIVIVSFFVLKDGTFLNISPILGSGVKNIAKSSIESGYDYALLELAFVIYPFVDDKTKTSKAILSSILYVCLIYGWISFISIYYMGADIINKTYWSFFTVTEAIKLEVLNNFRYIFVFLWLIVALKSSAIMTYICGFFVENIRGKKSGLEIYILAGVMALLIASFYYKENLSRNMLIEITSRYSIIFNCIYVTIISIFVFIHRRGGKYE